MATRWRSPPDSMDGYLCGIAGKADEAQQFASRASLRRSLSPAPKRSSEPSMTLSSAVRHGTSRGDWNTKAISAQASRGARPSTVTRSAADVEQAADHPQRGGFAAARRARECRRTRRAGPRSSAGRKSVPAPKRDADVVEDDDRAGCLGRWHSSLRPGPMQPCAGYAPLCARLVDCPPQHFRRRRHFDVFDAEH